MSQLAIHRPHAVDAPDVSAQPVDTAVFERLSIRAAEPFAPPRFRLVLPEHHEGGRRGPADLAASCPPGAARSGGRTARRPSGQPARRPACGPVRLTRRGRLVCVLLLAMVTTAVMFAVGVAPSHASPAVSGAVVSGPASGRPASVVVQPGDTLWSIALAAAPSADPRATVQKLIDANHIEGVAIEAGEVLVLPS